MQRGEALLSPLGNTGLKSKEKVILEKLGEFRKQEEFEDKKIQSKKEKSLSWTTVRGCVPGKKDKCRKIAVTEIES